MRLVDIDALSHEMYHLAFETDSNMQKWDGGCWIRYRMFEKCRDNAPTIDAVKIVRCKDCEFFFQILTILGESVICVVTICFLMIFVRMEQKGEPMLIVETGVLKKRIEQMKKYDNQKRILIKDVLKVIDDASRFSRIDEEVIRCQNCRYWYTPWCLISGRVQNHNFYCAYGRRKL